MNYYAKVHRHSLRYGVKQKIIFKAVKKNSFIYLYLIKYWFTFKGVTTMVNISYSESFKFYEFLSSCNIKRTSKSTMMSSNLPLSSAIYINLHELVRFLLSQSACWILMLIIFGFVIRHLYSKVCQRKVTKTFPTLSSMTYLRAMIVNRRRANSFFLQLIFGMCYSFPKEGMYGIMNGPAKFLFLYDLDAVKFILRNRTLLRKGTEYEFFRSYLKDGLLISTGKKWQTRRKQLIPSFHFRILDEFLVTFNKQAKIAVEKIDEIMKKETCVDIIDIFDRCTLDIILETAIGVNPQKLGPKREEFRKSLHIMEHIASNRVAVPWLWNDFIFSRTADAKILKRCSDFMHDFLRELLMERKHDIMERLNADKNNGVTQSNHDATSETNRHLIFLDLLMSLHLKDNSVSLENVFEEAQMFIAAAQHTTAVAVSCTLYLLSLHENIQRCVHQEVDAVLGDDICRTVTTEDVKSLKYLHCALKEAMRLYPPGGIVSRTLEEDTIINGCEISKGTSLVIPVYVLHRNTEVFPNPEEFIPDRFNEENLKNMHPYSYIPFSAGPRNCIGQQFATYSAMTILSNVLRHFSVQPVEHRDKIGLTFNVVTEPENEIHLKFSRRQFSC